MATSATPAEIHTIVTQADSPAKSATENARLRWVAEVDSRLIDKEGLAIMKLSMLSELTERECESIARPSDLYHALGTHYPDKDVQLARFIYALEKLGHRRYGCRAIRALDEQHRPKPFNLDQLPKKVDQSVFLVHQRLAVLCCMLLRDNYEKFVKYFTKKFQGNPSKYETPWEILNECLKREILTPANHLDEIEEALIKVETPESMIGEYFTHFNNIASATERNSATSSDSSPNRSQKIASKDKRSTLQIVRRSYISSGSTTPIPKSSSSEESSPSDITSNPSSPESEQHRRTRQATETTSLLGDNGQDEMQLTKKKKRLVGACCIVLSILLVLTAGAATLTGYGVQNYISHRTRTQRYQENSTVILTELDHFFIQSLSVMEDTEHLDDFDHDVTVYQADTKCSDLVSTTVLTISGSDQPIQRTFYALAGSSVSLDICGTTNLSTYPGRLNIILLNHLEESDTNELPYGFSFFEPGLKGEKKCKNMSFPLTASNYYTLSMPPPPPKIQMTFQFELTYNVRAIDPNLLAQHTVANYTLHTDRDSCNFSMNLDFESSCFVAVISENPNTETKDVHIQLSYGNRLAGLIAGAAILSVAVILVVIVIIVLAKISRFVH